MLSPSANGATHTSLGCQSPGRHSLRIKGLKVRHRYSIFSLRTSFCVGLSALGDMGMNQNLGLAAQAGMCQAFGLGKFSRLPTLIEPP